MVEVVAGTVAAGVSTAAVAVPTSQAADFGAVADAALVAAASAAAATDPVLQPASLPVQCSAVFTDITAVATARAITTIPTRIRIRVPPWTTAPARSVTGLMTRPPGPIWDMTGGAIPADGPKRPALNNNESEGAILRRTGALCAEAHRRQPALQQENTL